MESTRLQPTLLEIFWSFFLLGASSFGGPAIVPHIRQLVLERKGWVDETTFDTGNAMAQVLPGAITVQLSAYLGLRIRGLAGALTACAGYLLPPFLLMLLFSALYRGWHDNPAAAAGLTGLRAVVIGILAHAALLAWRDYVKTPAGMALAGAAALLFGLGAHPLYVIVGAGLAGFLLFTPGSRQPPAGRQLPSTPVPLKAMLTLFAAVAAGFAALYLFNGKLFPLALLMAKIDLLAFGGGYTSVPLIFHEVVEVRGWLDAKTLLDGMALGQLTPGPIVITATFVGYLLRGAVGAVAATVCIFLPSFLIVVLLSPQIQRLQQTRWFEGVIAGILCSFVGLIASSVYHFGRSMEWSAITGTIAIAAAGALYARAPILAVLAGGIIAALVFM